MSFSVFFRTTFEAHHYWKQAPAEVKFLRDLHRHIFHVKGSVAVKHSDRDVEFIILKRRANKIVADALAAHDTRSWSCEVWAELIGRELELDFVEVSEDGENGARWTR